MNGKNQKLEQEVNSIINQFNVGNHEAVISKVKKIIKKFPEYLILYNILGSAYQQIGEYNFARSTFLKAIKMDPNNITIMNNLANTHKRLEEFDQSEDLFKKIIRINPKYTYAFINYGNLKRDMNDFESAIELYKKALELESQLPVVNFALALAYQGIGKFDLAIDYANKTLKLDKSFTQADKIISQSKKYNSGDKHFIEMEDKIKNLKLNNLQKLNLHFALAKAYEDIGDIKNSFENLKYGNKLKYDSLNYNFDNEIKLFKDLKETFEKLNIEKFLNSTISKKKIIFILGMPRSGTTLVEQIISSHSKVFGAGELPYMSKILSKNFFNKSELSKEKIRNILTENNEEIDRIANEYLDYIDKFNTKENNITDKAPLNFRWIGFIKILFPNSKIIHCTRNPKDNCLSLFKNIFEGGLNFSYDQKTLGTFYNLYSDLMIFWNKKFSNFIHEANYEKILSNQLEESKKIIEFCGLDWEEECLNFHENKAPIKTMSTAQARKPLYKSSLNSYEKFSPYLETLNETIK